MWRRHQLLAQSALQRWLLPCSSRRGDAVVTAARRWYGAGGYQQVFYSSCVNKTSPDIFGSSHRQYRIQNIHSNDRTNDYSFQPATSFSTERKGRKLPPRFSDDSTVDELVQIAHDNLDVMTPLATAALWNKIFRQLSRSDSRSDNRRGGPRNSERRQLGDSQMERKLNDVFQYTRDGLGTFNMRELSQTIYSMAKAVDILRKQGKKGGETEHKRILRQLLLNKDMTPNEELFQLFADKAMDKLNQFDARHLSNLAYAFALIHHGAYATVNKPHSDLFEAMGDQILELKHLGEFKPQALKDVVWAYATAGVHHPKLFEKVAKHIIGLDHLQEFKPQHLSNTVWAYATADIGHPKLFEKIANHIVGLDSLNRFTHPQDVSNTVWAYDTADIQHPKLFEKMASHFVGLHSLDRFEPQALSNTLWAYATAGISHPKLFQKVANHMVELDSLDRFEPQALSNTVWAYAKAGIHHPKLFEKMANHIVGLDSLHRFNEQEFVNTMWAYATAGIHHAKLFEKMANHIVGLNSLDKFTHPQDVSNTVWAYATAGIHHPKLFEKVANHIVKHEDLNKFEPQALKDTVWAFATAQVSHPQLFTKVAKAAIHRKEEFNKSQGVANLLWAFATMGIVNKQLFSSFVPTAANLIDSYNNQGLANLAWAYAVADVDAPTLFNDHFINKCTKEKDGFADLELRQLHQWHLWRTKEKSNAGLQEELQGKCYEVFISEETTVSKFQDDVVTQLSSIGLGPKEEVLMDSGYRIDAVLEVNGKTIGVEVDGPYHFIGSSKSPLARTILKRRQVPAIDGIELVSVPYWEWNKLLGKHEVKRQEYLRELLGLTKVNGKIKP